MFEKKTVFVVGAGASKEYGLPIGDELKQEIPKHLFDKEGHLFDAIYRAAGGKANAYATASRQIADGLVLAPSIDRYMDVHQGDGAVQHVGKLAIAHMIQRSEGESTLVSDANDRVDLRPLANTWLPQLFTAMQEGARRDKPHCVFENVSFVCFNYDRIIEQFFFHAIRTFFGISNQKTSEALEHLRIVHPYGRIGRLPWEAHDGNTPCVHFSDRPAFGRLLHEMAGQIKTFTETISDDDGAYLQAREYLTQAEQIVFLGFSFLDQNMTFLTPAKGFQTISVKATVYGEAEPNIELAKLAIARLAGGLAKAPYNGEKPIVVRERAGRFMADYANTLRR